MSQSSERARRRTRRQQYARDIPTEERSIAAVRDLLAIWPKGPTVQIQKMDDHWVRAGMIWALAQHSVVNARAVLLLDEQRMYRAAAPLARVIYEAATTAAWAQKTTYAGHALFAQAQYMDALTAEDLAKMAGEPVPPQEARKGDWEAHRQMGKKFEDRFRDLDGGRWLQGWYRLLSGWSHGNGSVLATWLNMGDTDPAFGHGMSFRGDEDFRFRAAVLALTATMLNLALLSWNEVAEGSPLTEDLARLAKQHGLRDDLFEDENDDEDENAHAN